MPMAKVTKSLFKALRHRASKHDQFPVLKAMLSVQRPAKYNRSTSKWDPISSELDEHAELLQQGLSLLMKQNLGGSQVGPMFYKPGGSAVAALRQIFEQTPPSEAAIDAGFEGLRHLEANEALGEQLGLLGSAAPVHQPVDLGGALCEQPTPDQGTLLLAHPLLDQPSVSRGVLVVCKSGADGHIALVTNRPSQLRVGETFIGSSCESLCCAALTAAVAGAHVFRRNQVFSGGELSPCVSVLHPYPDLPGAQQVSACGKLWWQGDLEAAAQMVLQGRAERSAFKFISGYSGWGPGQLEGELALNLW
eukprot:TRINITY_DN9443_c0_g1_i1.p1 TRINITY_DN9443_c0_g1~~TRINITY_DN9443_c0_g1_i1.p1  ORF type:complete len:306 (-),score=86.14 TRINITY_DN9443_c0_g1_i1:183-1100(-)